MSAAVVSTSVIGSAAIMIHRGRGSDRVSARTCVSEGASVGEEQRGVEPEDHAALASRSASGIARGRRDIREDSRRPAEHRLVRPPCPTEDVPDRKRRRRWRCREAHQAATTPRKAAIDSAELGSAARCQSRTRSGNVGERERGGDDHRGQRWLREVPQQPGANSRMSVIAAAPTSPVTCVFAPACAATAVREPLVLTGNPWNNPAAQFAAPMPDHLPVAVDGLPRCVPRTTLAVEMVSASETTAMATAPPRPAGQETSEKADVRDRERGETLGQRADERRRRGPRGRNSARGGDRQHDGDQHAGDPRDQPLERQDQSQADAPTDAARGGTGHRRRPDPARSAATSSMKPSPSTEKPKSFGSWPTTMVSANPFM